MSIRRGTTNVRVWANHPPKWRGQREAELAAMHRAQGMSAREGENSRSEVEGEARQPGPKDAPNPDPEAA